MRQKRQAPGRETDEMIIDACSRTEATCEQIAIRFGLNLGYVRECVANLRAQGRIKVVGKKVHGRRGSSPRLLRATQWQS